MNIISDNPYIGPEPFEFENRFQFFGRDQEIEEILSLIISNKVLLLYAKSGAGKSSLINAGVLPELEKEEFEVLPIVRLGLGPSDEPVENIFLHNTLRSLSKIDEIDSWDSVYTYLSRNENPKLIVFDQFEELFNSFPKFWNKREEFIEEVVRLTQEIQMSRVVLVIREDYLAHIDTISQIFPEKLQARYRLNLLNKSQALNAITEPMRMYGKAFEENVADELVNELSRIRIKIGENKYEYIDGNSVDPVHLQLVCKRLWKIIPNDSVEISMNLIKNNASLDDALEYFYEKSLNEVFDKTGFNVRRLRDFFDTELITDLGTRGTIYRGEKSTGSIPNEIIDVLEEIRMVRCEIRSGARWYELTHDRFIDAIRRANKNFLLLINELTELLTNTQLLLSGYVVKDLKNEFREVLNLQKKFKKYRDTIGQFKVLNLLGVIKYRGKDYLKSINYFTEAINLNQNDETVYYLRGAAFWYNGNYEEAIEDYSKALILVDNKNSDILFKKKMVNSTRN